MANLLDENPFSLKPVPFAILNTFLVIPCLLIAFTLSDTAPPYLAKLLLLASLIQFVGFYVGRFLCQRDIKREIASCDAQQSENGEIE